ncbi:MAG: ATP-dependent DNA helicase [Candidatus Obscuribacterales bacterium]|nr:ATP-dependent DNA helicase [Candidatus Obscuribacterales bacterium]
MSVSEFLLEAVLQDRFGLEGFRPHQKEVIERIIAKRHTLALLPTGYGKSLCYQVPSQVLPGTTIVVSPLIALMQDQVSALFKRGIRNATYLNSSVSADELDSRIRAIKTGDIKLVYVAPERFESARFRQLLNSLEVSLVVIDEAHCISQWGHDFRLQYRNLSNYVAQIPGITVLALTATATPMVQRDIVQSLNLKRLEIVAGNFDRPNLTLEVKAMKSTAEKDSQLIDMLRQGQDASIVYTNSRKEAERLSGFLLQNGLSASCYHAGLTSSERHNAQRRFELGQCKIIVCTVAFGMGIDKADIRRVIHYNMPGSLESYYQEAGRAGRDGQQAICTLLHQPKDTNTQRWLIGRNYPEAEEVAAVFRFIKAKGLEAVRAQEILDNTQVKDTALTSTLNLLKHLQLVDTTPDGTYFDRSSGNDNPAIPLTYLHERKQKDYARLDHMLNYVQEGNCRRKQILDYFGQSLKQNCRSCDTCLQNEN